MAGAWYVGTARWRRAVADSLAVDRTSAIPVVVLLVVSLALVAFAIVVAMIPAHLALRRAPGTALRSE